MEKNDVLLSTCYLEFINNLDSLIYNLLYEENTGYTNMSSKQAVIEAPKIIEKYDYEAQKLAAESKFGETENVIGEKRKELENFINEYSKQEMYVWAQEVFEKNLDNSLFSAQIYKNKPEEIEKIFYRAANAINWISNVKNLPEKTTETYTSNLKNKLQKIVMQNDEDYLPKGNPEESDVRLFCKLRNDFLKNEFSEDALKNSQDKLSNEDFNYLTRLANDFKGYLKSSVTDEIILVNTAVSLMKLKNEKEKYDFIKEVDGDITIFLSKNKKIEEKEKIDIIKRRMKLFESSLKKEETSEYFKKLLTSS